MIKQKHTIKLALIAGVSLLGFSGMANANLVNLVADGNFGGAGAPASFTNSSWMVYAPQVDVDSGTGLPIYSSDNAFAGGYWLNGEWQTTAAASIYQIIQTTPGRTYTLSFSYLLGKDAIPGTGISNNPIQFGAKWGGINVFDTVSITGNVQTFTATNLGSGPNTWMALEFYGRNEFLSVNDPETDTYVGSYNYLTDVSLTENPIVAVPEPEEWAMMLLGFPMISWVSRRRKM